MLHIFASSKSVEWIKVEFRTRCLPPRPPIGPKPVDLKQHLQQYVHLFRGQAGLNMFEAHKRAPTAIALNDIVHLVAAPNLPQYHTKSPKLAEFSLVFQSQEE